VPGIFNLVYLFGASSKALAPGQDAGQEDALPETDSAAAKPVGVAEKYPLLRLAVIGINILLCAAALYYLSLFLRHFFSYASGEGMMETMRLLVSGNPLNIISNIIRVMSPAVAGLCAYSASTGKLRAPAGICSLILLCLSLSLLLFVTRFNYIIANPLIFLLLRGPWLVNTLYFFPRKKPARRQPRV
jgi:hypothetical protein